MTSETLIFVVIIETEKGSAKADLADPFVPGNRKI